MNKKGHLRHMIKKMLQGYKLSDPLVKREAPVTPALLRVIKKKVRSTRDLFIVYLLIGAFFYAMRSCKYVATTGELRMKIITTDRIHFFKSKGSSILSTSYLDSTASSMQIIFGI